MQQIINFLIKSRNTLWFLFLLLLALTFTIQSHNYHSNKFISSTSYFTGGILETRNSITSYFGLKNYNVRLLNENTALKQKIHFLEQQKQLGTTKVKDTVLLDSLEKGTKFKYIEAEVINSTYHKKKNYLTLNKGSKHKVYPDMGVVTDLGIVGIIEHVSNKYSKVISILNENSRINAQLKKTNHFGSLVWDGNDPNTVQLTDIPRLAPLKKGDTIVTGGRSTIFPKGILIGAIEDFSLDTNQNYFTVNVKLFNDMTDVGFVQLIRNKESEEIKKLESNSNE